jgi:hypothetical protein
MPTANIKTFITKSALAALAFVVLCVIASSAIYAVLGERSIADAESPFLVTKEEIARQDGDFDTVFVGSSITFRQINPAEFDDATGRPGFRSYNLGIPGLYPMRSISYLEHLVNNPPPNLKFVLCELFRLDTVTYNYKAPEIMRLMDWGSFYEILQTIAAANFPRNYKLNLAGQYLRAFAFKSMGFGMLDYMRMEREIRPRDQERLDSSTRGFLAKDVEIETSKEQENIDHLRETGAVLEQNPGLLPPRTQLHRDKYNRAWQLDRSPYVDKLGELITQAESKGIRLIFVLPPLMTQRGMYFAYPAFLQIPEHNRIDLSDPDRFPELYQIENVFDTEHVNSQGSVYLSRYLARELTRLETN